MKAKVEMILSDPKTGKTYAKMTKDQLHLSKEWILKLGQIGKPVAQVLAEITSRSGKKYEIIRGKDGVVYCTCPSWKMRKRCKHVIAFADVEHLKHLTAVKKLSKAAVEKKPEFSLKDLINAEVKKLSGR